MRATKRLARIRFPRLAAGANHAATPIPGSARAVREQPGSTAPGGGGHAYSGSVPMPPFPSVRSGPRARIRNRSLRTDKLRDTEAMASNKRNLLHSTYLVGIALKGLDGLIEIAAGTTLLVTSLPGIIRAAGWFARNELPVGRDFIANHAAHLAQHLAPGAQRFASAYLLIHGCIKVGLVAGLLRGWRHAYPTALLLLGAFIGYQCYHLFRYHSLLLAAFTAIDIAIVVLIWLEWCRVESARDGGR